VTVQAMTDFIIGQKWISNAEPELAMGRIIRLEDRTISVFFDLSSEERTYARKQAPLTRVKFNPGDDVATLDDIVITISSVAEKNGIFVYHGNYQGTSTVVLETELDPNVRFSKPIDRLLTHQIDANPWFNLRYETWRHMSRLTATENRGLYGPRVSLIPHQLYIANEVASRYSPRVLLADEVGLGKTIEAGLIIHQQLQTGRASRVLIIVPPALTFQWFVEMIRRFNLQFTVLDEERCLDILADNSELSLDDEDNTNDFNPFEAQQLMLCTLDLFKNNPDRLEQIVDTDLDLVVVDEAHHLQWSKTDSSIEYDIVEILARTTRGLLLLTATPEQLGKTGHFARLRLLDPNRFHDYDDFCDEEANFGEIAEAATDLLSGTESLAESARSSISSLLNLQADDATLISSLLDRHGTGRVLFRNVRSAIKGFPKRVLVEAEFDLPSSFASIIKSDEYPEHIIPGWYNHDPRLAWLVALLQNAPAQKFLLICADAKTAIEINKKLGELTNTRTTIFHEGMALVERDRAANYFAETVRGAQLLISSEIGSEGRNFQFASHLILFDLPSNPDLLEQRIGRLDRIGQQHDVTIHTPYFTNHRSHRLLRFYRDGLAAFTAPNPAGQSLFEDFGTNLMTDDLETIIVEVRQANKERQRILNKGRDRLLELNSHKPNVSHSIVVDVNNHQGGLELEDYMESSFDMFGLESEYTGENILTVKPTESMIRNDAISIETMGHYHYPELPEEGIRITYDRDTALAVEDVNFFTFEHPIVQQAMDLVTSDVAGNSTMIAVKHPSLPAGTLLVEALHIVDCVAPLALQADKYMPPRIIRSVITPKLADISSQLPYQDFITEQLDIPVTTYVTILQSQQEGIKEMANHSRLVALQALEKEKSAAKQKLQTQMDQELNRLKALRKVNNSIRLEEIEYLQETTEMLLEAIENADVRMDALRVIVAA
jgi:ATP-dependent helicase HepA